MAGSIHFNIHDLIKPAYDIISENKTEDSWKKYTGREKKLSRIMQLSDPADLLHGFIIQQDHFIVGDPDDRVILESPEDFHRTVF